MPDAQLFSVQTVDDYYKEIIDFLTIGIAPTEYSVQQKKQLVVKVADFTRIAGQLYKLGPDEVLQKSVLDHERPMILVEPHARIAGGNYS